MISHEKFMICKILLLHQFPRRWQSFVKALIVVKKINKMVNDDWLNYELLDLNEPTHLPELYRWLCYKNGRVTARRLWRQWSYNPSQTSGEGDHLHLTPRIRWLNPSQIFWHILLRCPSPGLGSSDWEPPPTSRDGLKAFQIRDAGFLMLR